MGKSNYKLLCIVLSFMIIVYPFSPPVLSKSREEYKKEGVIWDLPVQEKLIALTFDDGPHYTYTPQILDLLAEYDAKATFFIIGSRLKSHQEIIKRQIAEGHEHANHTFSHYRFKNLSKEQIKHELKLTEQEYKKITSRELNPLFRPPGGNYNSRIVEAVTEEDYLVIMWSWHQDSRDWSRPGVAKIVHNVLSDTRPGDIVLFHDGGGNREQTIEALKTILPALKDAGYRMVTVSELLFIHKLGSSELK